MKKSIVAGLLVLILGISFYLYLENNKITTFGEAFKNGFDHKSINEITVEDRQFPDKEFNLTEAQLMNIVDESSEMKIRKVKSTPMMSYEVKILYDDKGIEKTTGFVLGYNNVLQMIDGHFYEITSPNTLSEEIRKELNGMK
ncbi:hypothetical protein PGH26_08640 [Sporosarcina jeotgali]|uniref:DUF1310 domain-containing protein n=1 Tax=Sporosarcina jeotgali TaxID=3020056 RepID=A0ABZ0KST3_9BACL|nr:hypothetical protein [Sporosarcina sp. B2O-1]WOV83009.1 hypothetical protein PGH26_08640 [Sporosarcina sp. B2O-1]